MRRFDFAGAIRNESCESTRIAAISYPLLLPTESRFPVRRFDFARDDSVTTPYEWSRIVSASHESTQVCRHVLRTRNVHASLFHGWCEATPCESSRIVKYVTPFRARNVWAKTCKLDLPCRHVDYIAAKRRIALVDRRFNSGYRQC